MNAPEQLFSTAQSLPAAPRTTSKRQARGVSDRCFRTGSTMRPLFPVLALRGLESGRGHRQIGSFGIDRRAWGARGASRKDCAVEKSCSGAFMNRIWGWTSRYSSAGARSDPTTTLGDRAREGSSASLPGQGIDVGHDHAGPGGPLGDDLAPGIDHHAVAVSLPAVRVLSPWAGASTQARFSIARARSSVSQCARPSSR